MLFESSIWIVMGGDASDVGLCVSYARLKILTCEAKAGLTGSNAVPRPWTKPRSPKNEEKLLN